MTTPRALLGKLPDGTNFGLRVSKPGFDATNDSIDHKNVAFDSRWEATAKLIAAGHLTGTGSAITVSYGKTYSYTPTVLAQSYPSLPSGGTVQNWWTNDSSFAPSLDPFWVNPPYEDVSAYPDHFVWNGSFSGAFLIYIVMGL